MNTGEIRRANL